MKKQAVIIWQLAFSYIGAVVGAGFASGQEIIHFFGRFGFWGVPGALLAGLLLAYFGYLIITTASVMQLNSYEQYLAYVLGPSKAKYFDGVISLFLLSGLAVMLVAAGSLFNQLWGWRTETGFILNAVFLYILMLIGVKGMLWLNTLLIPCLLAVSMLVTWFGLNNGGGITCPNQNYSGFITANWFFSSLLYVSYNLVLGMVVLVTLGRTAARGGRGGAIIGGVAIGIMAAFLSLSLSLNSGIIAGQDLPLLALAGAQGALLKQGYSFVLWAAIISTALANCLGLLGRLEQILSWPKAVLAFLPFLPAFSVLGWSLGRAVGFFYPLMGYLGLFLLFQIIIDTKRRKHGIR